MGRMISITEYARRNGKSPVSMRQKAQRNMIRSAVKVGNIWMVDEDEPLIDNRYRDQKEMTWETKELTATVTPEKCLLRMTGNFSEEDLRRVKIAVSLELLKISGNEQ